MKYYWILLIVISSYAQEQKFKLHVDHSDKIIKLYVDNYQYCPVTLNLSYKLQNLRLLKPDDTSYIIPARAKKFLLTKLERMHNNLPANLNFDDRYFYGIKNNASANLHYSYHLPFALGASNLVVQGPNGVLGHKDQHAVDFRMEYDSEVVAMRAGIVVQIIDTLNTVIKENSCTVKSNMLLVYHEDGTFAQYSHFKKNGIVVKVGDRVQEEQLLGYAGNVNFGREPHMHFEVFKGLVSKKESIPISFLIDYGFKIKELENWKYYTKYY